MRLSVPGFLILAVLSIITPCMADIIPNEPETGAADSVTDRLAAIGVSRAGAQAMVEELLPAEQAYFAAHPNSIAVVGQEQAVLWYEWVFGTFWFVATAVAVFAIWEATDN